MSDVGQILRQARQELLELSADSWLLDTPRHRARATTVEVIGARSETVFRRLVDDGKGLSFRPRPEPYEIDAEPGSGEHVAGDDLLATLPPPAEIAAGEGGVHHQELWHDCWLQTELGAERLQGRLLRLHHEARSHYEERGVGALYLALGFVEWQDAAAARQRRHAPLILVPVRLERGSAVERFRLWFADDEIATNLALAERLRQDLGLSLPEIDPVEHVEPAAYLRLVSEAVRAEPRLRLHADDVVLGLFSIAPLLMWRDLDPAAWPADAALEERPLLRALLSERLGVDPGVALGGRALDAPPPPRDALHVLDADASQAVALAAVRLGQNLIIEGAPGTGKSQTIANLIAAAVHDGKTVLVLAQKIAALEDVRCRLDQIGLGELCLELHGRCASRRGLLEELERTLQLGAPQEDDPADPIEELAASSARLDRHARSLHRPAGGAGVTPFEAIGRLAELRGRGAPPCPVKLPGASHWSRAELRARRDQVSALAQRIAGLGTPAGHPWRGVGLAALLPGDDQTIGAAVAALHEQLATLLKAVTKLEQWLGTRPAAETREQIARVLEGVGSLARLPAETDALALRAAVWEHEIEALQSLVAAGTIFGIARNDLRRVVNDDAWSLDLTSTRQALAGQGARWWRSCSCAWRRARARLRALVRGAPPTALAGQLALLDRLIDARAIRQQILDADALGRAAFGSLWAGEGSDWGKLGAVLAWRRDGSGSPLMPGLLHLLAEVGDRRAPIMLAAHSRRLLDAVQAGWSELVGRLQLEPGEAFGEPRLENVALTRVLERLGSWAAQPAGLAAWLDYGAQKRRAVALGMSGLSYQLHSGGLPAARALDAFDQAYYEPLLRQAVANDPTLAAFAGPDHEQLIERFQELDRERIRLARQQVAAAHHARLPPRGEAIGQLGLLEREFAKKRRQLPIRQLLARAGQPIQAIKPVLMMSPSAVAEFLAPAALRFDLLVIDEAGLIEPAHAFGAIARATQMVVVGDRRQLPPSRSSNAARRDEPSAPGGVEGAAAGKLASVLDACAAAGMAQRQLRSHYRSRHPSLIALANRAFYDDRLSIVPSPFADHPQLGLGFRHVPDGGCERGVNRGEAELVAQAAIAHARSSPELSLGVGCLALRQRDAILAELERLWRAEPPEVREFFEGGRPEPFFVKDQESIQGDARDVILVSVGYGRDTDGALARDFGPLERAGAERGLNVLITRARARLELFASLTAAEIDLARTRARGVAVLKSVLHDAATGALGAAGHARGFASPFEAEVARAIAGLGYEVEGQVGVAGCFIDLAVRDRDRPLRYLLGILCDGTAYQGAVWARDRDRLRPQLLEDQGWILHRVWSLEWLRDPAAQLGRVAAALEEARARWAARDESLDAVASFADQAENAPDQPVLRAPGTVERELAPDLRALPYREADFPLPDAVEPHRLAPEAMAETVARIVELEGPVHRDEIARRVTRLAGLERTGRRIAEAVDRGLARAVGERRIAREGRFYAVPGAEPPIRDRSAVQASTLRRPEMLPPVEIQAAVLEVAGAQYGATTAEIASRVGRLLGFQTTSARLRGLIEAETLRLLATGRLDRQGPALMPVQPDSRPAA